ncbi:hypothetical protein LshimejAT787_1103870 [Lyophyllum shimeji]|uniref:Uncharacterized protein n=1 Tax=Lyophyllum shimeji TaxID=47721 RepID=A0A9P3URM1_LYOSH|nr:hypothetical protein LshimejAT787_1103870 [Lyophyllum shimeji]
MYRPVRRLLPNLSAFSPEFDLPMPNMRTSLLFVPALLSSTVTEISIVATDPTVPPELPTLLSSIARLCPNLRFLRKAYSQPPLSRVSQPGQGSDVL